MALVAAEATVAEAVEAETVEEAEEAETAVDVAAETVAATAHPVVSVVRASAHATSSKPNARS